MREVIARAETDDDVAAWIREHADPAKFDAINAALERLTVGQRLDDPAFMERYPIARTLPPQTPRIDLLIADDAETFASGGTQHG